MNAWLLVSIGANKLTYKLGLIDNISFNKCEEEANEIGAEYAGVKRCILLLPSY